MSARIFVQSQHMGNPSNNLLIRFCPEFALQNRSTSSNCELPVSSARVTKTKSNFGMYHMISRRQLLFAAVFSALIPTGVLADDHVITASDAYAAMKEGTMILIDVRRPYEWLSTGVAAGAWLLDMTDENFGAYLMAVLERNPSHDVAIVCRTGNRTGRLQSALQDSGITRVPDVTEGMAGGPRGQGWIPTGLPIVEARVAYDAMPKDLTASK